MGYYIRIILTQTIERIILMGTPTETIIPEIDEIVNFYKPELVEKIAKDEGFVQRESTLGGIEFLAIMTYGWIKQDSHKHSIKVYLLCKCLLSKAFKSFSSNISRPRGKYKLQSVYYPITYSGIFCPNIRH